MRVRQALLAALFFQLDDPVVRDALRRLDLLDQAGNLGLWT
jgi:hypothetical protein